MKVTTSDRPHTLINEFQQAVGATKGLSAATDVISFASDSSVNGVSYVCSSERSRVIVVKEFVLQSRLES